MAHLMSLAEVELAKALCGVAGMDSQRVQRVEMIMEVGCATIVRVTALVLDDAAPVKAMQTQLREFKLVPLEA